MDSNIQEDNSPKIYDIPEHFIDAITEEFAYDPVRLPLDQDPKQHLYNRKTLQKISEITDIALNPHTRQPFDINCVIPQNDLRNGMREYILQNEILPNAGFDIISDYDRVLNGDEMRDYLIDFTESIPNALTTEHDWEEIWKKFNLLRLYFQYHVENIEAFRSIDGFSYLHSVFALVHFYVKMDTIASMQVAANETCSEIVRMLDVLGLRERDVMGFLRSNILNFLSILQYVERNGYMKTKDMVLGIHRQLMDECGDVLKDMFAQFPSLLPQYPSLRPSPGDRRPHFYFLNNRFDIIYVRYD